MGSQSADYMSPYYGPASYGSSISPYYDSYGSGYQAPSHGSYEPMGNGGGQPNSETTSPMINSKTAPKENELKDQEKAPNNSGQESGQTKRAEPEELIKKDNSSKKDEKKESSNFEKQLSKFEDNMTAAKETVEQFNSLKNIKTHMTNTDEPDFALVTDGIKDLVSAIKGAKKNLDSLVDEAKKAPMNQKIEIQKAITDILSKATEDIGDVITNIKDIQNSQVSLVIPPVKRFFYLGEEDQKNMVLANTPKEFHPFVEQQGFAIATKTAPTLFSIVKEWDDLNDTFKKDFNELLPKKRRRR